MNAELIELRDSARQVLAAQGLAGGLAAAEDKSWAQVHELGWLLVAVPEDLGGLGQGLAGAAAFHAEFGRSLGSSRYLAAMLAIDAIGQSDIADRAGWIERLSTRDFATAALAGSALRLGDDGARLHGTVQAVVSADAASHLLVGTADERWIGLLPLRQPGIDCVSRPTWDETRRLFDVRIDNAAAETALVLARGDAAVRLNRRLAVQRDFALAADAVGGADALLQMTIDYLQTRRQFGRPLALFQALKHRCADLKAQVLAAEALLADSLSRAGDALDTAAAATLGRGAKSLACTNFARVAEEALQLHGGIGMTAEHACHRFLKRALLNEHLGRDTERYALDIADALLSGA